MSPQSRRRVRDPQRSIVANGSALLPGIDGRSAWARRCKDILAEHVSDKGGPDNCSAGEKSIIRRAACLTTELEMLEAKFAAANGDAPPTTLDLYIRGCSSLRRLLESIGLERRPRTINDDVFDEVLAEELER
jgi:hypothetical protein